MVPSFKTGWGRRERAGRDPSAGAKEKMVEFRNRAQVLMNPW